MARDSIRRRRFLGVAATTIGVGLAGCSGGSADENSGSDATTEASDGGSGAGESGGADFGGWFDNVGNFDGVTDKTGQSEVTVEVGAQGNGGGYAFAPPAISVDAGTTVVWEWTGEGGMHNVAEEDGAFESEMKQEAGHTFSHTFDSAGTFKYKCVPHEAMGMKGAVVVK